MYSPMMPHLISVSWQSELLVSSWSVGVAVSLCHTLMPVENSSGFAFLVHDGPRFVFLSFSLFVRAGTVGEVGLWVVVVGVLGILL